MRRANSHLWLSVLGLAGALLFSPMNGAIAQQQAPQMGQGMMNQGMMGPGMMGPGMMGPGMMGPGMMGQGMMGPGMMGSGIGCPAMADGGMMSSGMMQGMMGHHGGMGPGMMGHGMMGQGMMGQGMMGDGMMGDGMMGDGMTGGRLVMVPAPPMLTVADVTYNLEQLLAARGNARLKVGPVTDKDEATITGDIVTNEGSLVERYEVDKRSGVASLVP